MADYQTNECQNISLDMKLKANASVETEGKVAWISDYIIGCTIQSAIRNIPLVSSITKSSLLTIRFRYIIKKQ